MREPVYRLPVWSSWFLPSGLRHKTTKVLVSVNIQLTQVLLSAKMLVSVKGRQTARGFVVK